MAVNKVVYGGSTIIDISDSTVTEDTLSNGVTAYSASGEKITGTRVDVTYSTGTETTEGLTKLYSSTGSATDGAMTQKAATEAIESKTRVKIVRWS